MFQKLKSLKYLITFSVGKINKNVIVVTKEIFFLNCKTLHIYNIKKTNLRVRCKNKNVKETCYQWKDYLLHSVFVCFIYLNQL